MGVNRIILIVLLVEYLEEEEPMLIYQRFL